MPKRLPKLDAGFKQNSWTVIKEVSSSKYTEYLCTCVCGLEKTVSASNLLNGKSKSCGKGACKIKYQTHGMTDTPLYGVWCGIKYRTKNPVGKNACYAGISLCSEWETFSVFQEWAINSGYRQGLSIDRIDGSKGYFPQNCRWTDAIVQSQNRRGWSIAEVPFKGVFKSKPRAGKIVYKATGKAPYYWLFFYKGIKHQMWGFETAEEAYKSKCEYIEQKLNGLALP